MSATAADDGVCPECEGRGWVLEADGAAGAARRCSCRQDEAVPRLLAAAHIPPRYAVCSLANFDVEDEDPHRQGVLVRAKSLSERYVESFLESDGRFTESGLVFVGPPGVGKTHLAVGVMKQLIRRFRVRGLFVDFTSLLNEIQSTFAPGSARSKSELLHPATEAELVVLDELGAQKPSSWVMEILYLILNGRYSRRLPTLFTTNYRLEPERTPLEATSSVGAYEMLSSRISAGLISRLYQMARTVEIEADDFRKKVKRHLHAI